MLTIYVKKLIVTLEKKIPKGSWKVLILKRNKSKTLIFVLFFNVTGEASEYFREIGGLMFVNDLAKSSIHGIVKEAALFTLGITMESNGNK